MTTTQEITKRYSVVLADDNKEMRHIVAQHLGPEFVIVCSVSDGRGAVDAALELDPDIGILDISMPVMNGIDAAAEIRRRGLKMKIIFLTVNEDPEFLRAAFEAGAIGYVVKRQLSADLPDALKAALAGKKFVSPACSFPIDM